MQTLILECDTGNPDLSTKGKYDSGSARINQETEVEWNLGIVSMVQFSCVTKVMVLKAEMQSQETEPSNFYSLPLIEAEEDIQSCKFEAVLPHHSV